MPSSVIKGSPCPYRTWPAEGRLHHFQTRTLNVTFITPSPLLSLSLSWWVFFNVSFCVMLLHASLHSAETFTTFWWMWPTGKWASTSGVITGGVGMLMIAVVIWLLWQFRGVCSSTRMFKLERLFHEKKQNVLANSLLVSCYKRHESCYSLQVLNVSNSVISIKCPCPCFSCLFVLLEVCPCSPPKKRWICLKCRTEDTGETHKGTHKEGKGTRTEK